MSVSGKIAFVDLNHRAVVVEALPSEWRYRFLGGRGLNAYLVFRHLEKEKNLPGAKNSIVLGGGLITGLGGTPLECAGFSTRFPLTGRYGFAGIPGGFGAGMRWAGFDHIVISGKAERPVHLVIQDGDVTFESAERLKEKKMTESLEKFRKIRKFKDFRIVLIEPEGEKRVPSAHAVTHDGWIFGKSGAGESLMAKNVMAVVCIGTHDLPVKHPQDLLDLFKSILDEGIDRFGYPPPADIFPGTRLLESGRVNAMAAAGAKKGSSPESDSLFRAGERSLPSDWVYEIIANCLGLGAFPFFEDAPAAFKTFRNLIRFASGLEFTDAELVDAAFRAYALERLIDIQVLKIIKASKKLTMPKEKICQKGGWDRRSLMKLKVFRELGIEDLWPRVR